MNLKTSYFQPVAKPYLTGPRPRTSEIKFEDEGFDKWPSNGSRLANVTV